MVFFKYQTSGAVKDAHNGIRVFLDAVHLEEVVYTVSVW